MKRIFGLIAVLVTLALGTSVFAGAFTAGDIVVYRIGDGSQNFTNIGNTVFLDEYTTNQIIAMAGCALGHCTPLTPAQTIMMPTNWVGNQAPLIANGSSQIEGLMTRSLDGRYLVVPGFGCGIGQLTNLTGYAFPTITSNADVSGAYATNAVTEADVPRVIGLVDGNGNVYTSTTITNSNEEDDEIRSAASTDGTNIWYAGGDDKRVKYTTRGSQVSTQVCALTIMEPSRAVGIFGNVAGGAQLYLDKNSAFAVATNMNYVGTFPTNVTCTTTNILNCTNITTTVTLLGCTTNVAIQGCITNLTGCTTNTVYTTNVVVGCSTNVSGCTTQTANFALNLISGDALPVYSIPTNFVVVAPVTNGSQMGFAMFNLNNANNSGNSPDTLYLADSAANFIGEKRNYGGAVEKYSYVSGNWVYSGSIGAEDAFDVAGYQNGQNVALYITEATNANMFYYQDTTGYNNNTGEPEALALPTTLAPGGLVDIAGIAPAPQGGDSGTISGAGGGPVLVGPPYGPYFRGPQGGPFTPANGVAYSVANFGAQSTNYQITTGINWLTITPGNGTVTANGGSATVTITANSNANSLNGGQSYSGNIIWHTGGPSGKAYYTNVATIVVDAFYLNPTTNFISLEAVVPPAPGSGVFTPSSTVYAMSNATPGALNYSAFTSNNWTSLSTSIGANPAGNNNVVTGSVPGHTAANITVSINANADSLVDPASYDDYLVLSNVNAGTQLSTKPGILLQVGFGIFDDFTTFTVENVAGQNGWNGGQVPPDVNAVQILTVDHLTNCVGCAYGVNEYVVPGGCANANGSSQQPYKYVSAGPITNALNIVGTVTNNVPTWAVTGALITFTNAPTTANYVFEQGTVYLAWNDAGIIQNGSSYSWSCELDAYETGGGTIGTSTYSFGKQYQVYFVTDFVESNAYVFVNPPSPGAGITDALSLVSNWGTSTMGAEAVLAVHTVGGGAGCPGGDCIGNSAQGWESITLGQYSAACPANNQPGYFVTRVAASTNYIAVYNWLEGGLTAVPTNSFTVNTSSGPAPLSVNFTDTSTGGPTTWLWTFGDCDSSTNENPSYEYLVAGVYTAKLVTANLGGAGVGTATEVITVTTPVSDPFTSWDNYYFPSGGPNSLPNVDVYGTGMSNTNKFQAGFSGSNASAYLHVISASRALAAGQTNVTVTYLGASGDTNYTPGVTLRTNILEYTTGTANGSYATNNFLPTGQTNILGVGLSVNGGTGLGTVTNMTDTAVYNTNRYYRVRVLLP